jgi:hypothetical protein
MVILIVVMRYTILAGAEPLIDIKETQEHYTVPADQPVPIDGNSLGIFVVAY